MGEISFYPQELRKQPFLQNRIRKMSHFKFHGSKAPIVTTGLLNPFFCFRYGPDQSI